MTLQAFQRALCELIASPALCLDLRAEPERVLARYDLSELERRRLVTVVWQPGMSTTCSLYRNNRITPVYTLLPHTCFLLGDRLKDVIELFWKRQESTDVQFKHEIDRFGAFLTTLIDSGEIVDPYLKAVLAFELAENALRYLPCRQIAENLRAAAPDRTNGRLRPHPLARVVRFRHDPAQVFHFLKERHAIPDDLPHGTFFVAISVVEEELVVRQIDSMLGRSFLTLAESHAPALSRDEIDGLIDAGLAVPAC